MTSYSKDKEISKLVKKLIKLGWSYRRGRKHGLVYAPLGGRVVVPGTPSDKRSFYNFRQQVKRLSIGSYSYA